MLQGVDPTRVLLLTQISRSSHISESVHCPASHSCINVPLPFKPQALLPSITLSSVQTSGSVHVPGLSCQSPFTHISPNSPRLFSPQAPPPLGRVSLFSHSAARLHEKPFPVHPLLQVQVISAPLSSHVALTSHGLELQSASPTVSNTVISLVASSVTPSLSVTVSLAG